jgi:hypothetical protein
MKNPVLLYILLLLGLILGVYTYYLTYQKSYMNTGHYDEGLKVTSHKGLPVFREMVQSMKDLGENGFFKANAYYDELQAKYNRAILTRNLFLVGSAICLTVSLIGLYRFRKEREKY